MLRVKLTIFFVWMAVVTLFRPREGIDMVACAKRGAKLRHRERVFAHYRKLMERGETIKIGGL